MFLPEFDSYLVKTHNYQWTDKHSRNCIFYHKLFGTQSQADGNRIKYYIFKELKCSKYGLKSNDH